MTGPEGDQHSGMWRVTSVDPPTSLQFTDAFADSSGAPLEDAPVSEISVRLLEHEGGTRMELRMTFESREDMDRIVDMGTVEALKQGVSQMEGMLAPSAPRGVSGAETRPARRILEEQESREEE